MEKFSDITMTRSQAIKPQTEKTLRQMASLFSIDLPQMDSQKVKGITDTLGNYVRWSNQYYDYRQFMRKLKPKGIMNMNLKTDLRKEPAYADYQALLEEHPLKNTMGKLRYHLSLRYALKYDKFMQRSEICTMCTPTQMFNVIDLVSDVIRNRIPGDLFEAGCWKGGMGMLMKEVLRRHDDKLRHVWLADAWGKVFPSADTYNDADIIPILNRLFSNRATQEQVKENFKRESLWDERIHLIEGYFEDTLPSVPVEQIAVLRLDPNVYNSTMDILTNLYPKLSSGGYVIIDDYGTSLCDCRRAINEFRQEHNITSPIKTVDMQCAYWQKDQT